MRSPQGFKKVLDKLGGLWYIIDIRVVTDTVLYRKEHSMKFLFSTSTTMKPYNRNKWWVDMGYVRTMRIDAETLEKAVLQYRDRLSDEYAIEISNTALKGKSQLFYDDKDGNSVWCGYVFTGKMPFQNDETGKWSNQYIELWTDIEQVKPLAEIGIK